jgi:isocitrate lyase
MQNTRGLLPVCDLRATTAHSCGFRLAILTPGRVRGGVEYAAMRARAFAPYADLLWMETSRPDEHEASKVRLVLPPYKHRTSILIVHQFAQLVLSEFPHAMLAYNLSPSFNWDDPSLGLNDDHIRGFCNRV